MNRSRLIDQRPWLGTLLRLVLGVVWIWAAASKLSSPRTFVQAVRAYDATPEWLSKGIGYGLPVLEMALGVLLVLGVVVRAAAAVSGVLFLVFLIGLIQAAARGISLECGCFGGGGTTEGTTTYGWDILRDLLLLACAAFLVVWSFTRISVDEYLARHDRVTPPSAKRMRTPDGRKKYNALLEQRRAAARSRTRWLTVSVASVVVLVTIIGIGVQSGRAKIEGSLTATNATTSNGVVFGKKAAATVDLYEDFQCPNCLNYYKTTGATLDKLVRANHAQARFHMISILDRSSSGNRYSSRAANAGYCASDLSVDDFVAYYKVLYTDAVQPKEGSNGRTDTQLIGYARQAGITGTKLTTFSSCVTAETHKAFVEAVTEKASERGVSGTPTVYVNGKQIGNSLSDLTKAIAAADAKGPAAVPSVTPSPSPSSSAASSAASPGASSSPATSASSAATSSAAASPSAAAGSSASASAKAGASKSG